uniref:Uncharacterized protein n=1 Tax=Salmonella sp. 14 TaxID=1179812 RepID=I3W315_9ENTR|nr:hypothetical protein [Salmonella sp. 14]
MTAVNSISITLNGQFTGISIQTGVALSRILLTKGIRRGCLPVTVIYRRVTGV